jgi:hypothetical protein
VERCFIARPAPPELHIIAATLYFLNAKPAQADLHLRAAHEGLQQGPISHSAHAGVALGERATPRQLPRARSAGHVAVVTALTRPSYPPLQRSARRTLQSAPHSRQLSTPARDDLSGASAMERSLPSARPAVRGSCRVATAGVRDIAPGSQAWTFAQSASQLRSGRWLARTRAPNLLPRPEWNLAASARVAQLDRLRLAAARAGFCKVQSQSLAWSAVWQHRPQRRAKRTPSPLPPHTVPGVGSVSSLTSVTFRQQHSSDNLKGAHTVAWNVAAAPPPGSLLSRSIMEKCVLFHLKVLLILDRW